MVTEADLAVESLLRTMLTDRQPNDSILGEEQGHTGTGNRRWILDPIDGTRHFAAGRSDWGVHVALEADGEIVLGVVTRPAEEAIWWAALGKGAHLAPISDPGAGRRLTVSSTDELDHCQLTSWIDTDHDTYRCLESLPGWTDPVDLNAGLGVADGSLDILVERTSARIWDRAPYLILVEEAGGRFRDLAGGRDPDRQGCILSNGLLDDQLASVLGR